MNEFTFLSRKTMFNGFYIRTEIIDKIYDLCKQYNDYIEELRTEEVNRNPNSNGSFIIPHRPFECHFDEGKLMRLWFDECSKQFLFQ